uniref:1-acylglycerol-3-phosphate O-acyltransferase ABHD5 n=1 Tax=Sinocyclocheilus rhinocerous TaxID=307959 RepID=A0A673JYD2_9TELE
METITEKIQALLNLNVCILYRFAVYHRSWWISSWLPSWCPTSLSYLIKAENKILKRKCTVRVTPKRESSSDLSASGVQCRQVPLVLLHGFGGGVGLWVKNLPALALEGWPMFALDMLGFGRSSRPTFGRDAKDAEEQFVQALEDWRKAEGLEYMILLGHDLGGYVSTAYALKYPHRCHLVLVEPWGFAARPNVQEHWVPIWIKVFGAAMNPFNHLGLLRLAGPLGPLLLQLLRSDFKQKYASVFADDTVADYIYHVNAQTASGETAFKNMTIPYAWPQHPMMNRVEMISPSLPMTFIYGSRSSIDGQSGKAIQEMRPNSHTEIIVSLISGAGHYVFADQSEDFNQAVLKICNNVKHNGKDE